MTIMNPVAHQYCEEDVHTTSQIDCRRLHHNVMQYTCTVLYMLCGVAGLLVQWSDSGAHFIITRHDFVHQPRLLPSLCGTALL